MRMTCYQLLDPSCELKLRRFADFQAKAAQDAAQAVLHVAKLRLHQLAAVSSVRVSCASIDLQCTGRNQPSRISCAIPRASLRSDFTGIASNVLRTCRVSSSSTASPACRIAAKSHCDNGPASSPIRSRPKPSEANQV